jgi:hypothetical protein
MVRLGNGKAFELVGLGRTLSGGTSTEKGKRAIAVEQA